MDTQPQTQPSQKQDAQASETPQEQPKAPASNATPPAGEKAPDSKPEAQLPPDKNSQGAGTSDKQAEASRENGKKGGRPKGSLSEATRRKQLMRQILEKKVEEEIEPLLAAKFDLAKGHFMYITKVDPKTGKEIVEKVYKRSPDGKSLEYLIDQVIGKPTQPFEDKTDDDDEDLQMTEKEKEHIAYVLKNLKGDQRRRAELSRQALQGTSQTAGKG